MLQKKILNQDFMRIKIKITGKVSFLGLMLAHVSLNCAKTTFPYILTAEQS